MRIGCPVWTGLYTPLEFHMEQILQLVAHHMHVPALRHPECHVHLSIEQLHKVPHFICSPRGGGIAMSTVLLTIIALPRVCVTCYNKPHLNPGQCFHMKGRMLLNPTNCISGLPSAYYTKINSQWQKVSSRTR